MVCQTTVNATATPDYGSQGRCSPGTSQQKARSSRGGVANLLTDIGELAELQISLLAHEGRESARRMQAPVIVVIVAIAVCLAGLPILIAGVGLWMSSAWELPTAAGLGIAGGAAVAIGVGMTLLAVRRCSSAADPVIRSARELSTNLSAVRRALSESSAS